MKSLKKLMSKPWVAHLLRANARYGNRMGAQFAAAITYFSVLAMVPVLMVGFAALGFTITQLRPDLMDQLQAGLAEKLGETGLKDTVGEAVKTALDKWGTVGIIGLGSALYAGAGWISNLKTAIRAHWRPELESPEKKHMIVIETLLNMAILLGLLVLGLVSVAASFVGTALNDLILSWLHLDHVPGATQWTWLVAFAIAVVTSTALFAYVYRVMPQQRAPRRDWLIGSLVAGVGLALLQSFAGFLMRQFTGNAAAAAFGPVIVLMLVFNIFAQLTLYVAAWIATTNQPAVARVWNDADAPLQGKSDVECVDDHWAAALEDKRRKEAEKNGETAPEDRPEAARPAWTRQQERAGVGPVPPRNDPETMVPSHIAEKGVKVGTGVGYAVGAATGVGLGAVLARLAHAWASRRR